MKNQLTTSTPLNGSHKDRKTEPLWMKLTGIIFGSVLAAVGLELFLMPHGIVVGGITGLSTIFALSTELRLGLFLFLLNLPFIVLQRKYSGNSVSLLTFFGVLIISLGTFLLHPFPALLNEPLAAALLGGLSLGFGIGLALRFGSYLDSAEKAVSNLPFTRWITPEGLVMLFNCLVLVIAGFHFGFEQAIYSVTAYLLAYESIKLCLSGFRFYNQVQIESHHCAYIQEALSHYLNRKADFIKQDSQDGEPDQIQLKCHRWEVSRLKAIVLNCDPDSEILILP